MKQALDQFRTNLRQVRQLVSLHDILRTQTTDLIDLSDILRASYVLGVSTMDYYIHELVRFGMLEVHDGKRATTKNFLRFGVSIESTRVAISNPTDNGWLDSEIRARHGWQSFQQPDNISKAVRLIYEMELWDRVASAMSETDGAAVKTRLRLIADRRNKIAHEADMDPTFPGARWPIDRQLVDGALDFIERFAESLFTVVS